MNNFLIIIPAYKSQHFLDKCLLSIWEQEYDKTKIKAVVIDDNSPIPLNINKYDYEINIIRNETRMYAAYNRYMVYSKAKDDDLIIFLDGDDWFTDKHVLQLINKIYKNINIKWSISNHKIFKNNRIKIKPCFVNDYIKGKPHICHLRIGYGYIWNKMNIDWIRKDNKYIKWMSDWNENLYALKMYGSPYKINSSLCVYNMDTSKTRNENNDYNRMLEYFEDKMI